MEKLQFRAWCEDEKRFYTAVLNKGCFSLRLEHEIESTPHSYQLSDWEQRSESTDKNGKYIYDGDIIKYDDNYSSGFPARMDAGNLRRVEYCGDLYEHGKNNYFRHVTFSANLCEVIGNIHETPELLKLIE